MRRFQYDESASLALREKRFLGKDAFRIDVSSKECMSWLGRTVGSLAVKSFRRGTPVKAVCLYGACGAGKSFLANEILHGLEDASDCTIEGRTRFNVFPDTFPKCKHVDWWMWRRNPASRLLPEYRRPVLAGDEFLIGEWCSEIPSEWLEEDRLDIEVSCGNSIEWAVKRRFIPVLSIEEIMASAPSQQWKVRVATLAGFGNGNGLIGSIAEMPKFAECRIEI